VVRVLLMISLLAAGIPETDLTGRQRPPEGATPGALEPIVDDSLPAAPILSDIEDGNEGESSEGKTVK
jgi:hypothetical protein